MFGVGILKSEEREKKKKHKVGKLIYIADDFDEQLIVHHKNGVEKKN